MDQKIKALLWMICCFISLPLAAAQSLKQDECVILLHGLGRTERSMLGMKWQLMAQGFAVENIRYPSLQFPISELSVLAMNEGLERCRERGSAKIHIVTHSLGGILVRQYVSSQVIDELGRVVMLGPPNQGSQLADAIAALQLPAWMRILQPPAAAELVTGEHSLPASLGAVQFEVGVIAGTKNHRPLLASQLAEPNDGTVTVAETRLQGMKDFIQLPTTHTFMMWSTPVVEQTGYFLRQGQFNHQPLSQSEPECSTTRPRH